MRRLGDWLTVLMCGLTLAYLAWHAVRAGWLF